MITRHSEARWTGNLEDGSGSFTGRYGFKSRFASGPGTNPEELIAAAYAGCYSMAPAHALGEQGHHPRTVHTVAKVSLNQKGGGVEIPEIELITEADVPGLDAAGFQAGARDARENCPVSQVLAGAKIHLNAKLVG